jgi:prepilin-type N-terminal cleavage/methylation domain-containing protein
MFMHKSKKGFTIVELVIVIAVIAILAAVLIPTFSNLVKKANISNDTSVAKNLNTALTAYEAANGTVKEFSEVLAAARDAGFIIGNLNPTTDGHYFVWESKSNQILLVDGEDDYKIVYQAKDVDPTYAKIEGGSWYIATADSDALAGVTGVNTIPALSASKVDGKGEVVKNILKDGGTVILSESINVTTAPEHADGAGKQDGIRVNAAAETTLDLNGQTMNAEFTTADFRVFQVATDFNICNGTIVASGEAKEGGLWGVVRAYNGSQVNVKNMTISYTNTMVGNSKGAPIFSIAGGDLYIEDTTILSGRAVGMEIGGNSTATLKNVTLKGTGDEGWVTGGLEVSHGGTINIESGYYEAQGDILYVLPTGGTINVNGGTFVGGVSIHNPMNGGTTGKIVISGGTFNGKSYDSYSAQQWADMVGTTKNNVSISNGVVTIVVNG